MTTRQLEKGKDRIQQICDILKNETLQPAKEQALEILEEAKAQAATIIQQAKTQAEKISQDARKEMEKERAVFTSALQQSAVQAVESLKQTIQNQIFNTEIEQMILKEGSQPQIVAKIIEAIIKAIEKEGVEISLTAIIPTAVSVEEVNRLLGRELLNHLREKSVVLGPFGAGAQMKIHNKQLMLDISDQVLKELLGNFLRKDFRKLLFQA